MTGVGRKRRRAKGDQAFKSDRFAWRSIGQPE